MMLCASLLAMTAPTAPHDEVTVLYVDLTDASGRNDSAKGVLDAEFDWTRKAELVAAITATPTVRFESLAPGSTTRVSDTGLTKAESAPLLTELEALIAAGGPNKIGGPKLESCGSLPDPQNGDIWQVVYRVTYGKEYLIITSCKGAFRCSDEQDARHRGAPHALAAAPVEQSASS